MSTPANSFPSTQGGASSSGQTANRKGSVVEVRGLSMAYGRVAVLQDVDLTVTEGEIVALTGVNGVGKSTLLSCLAGFRPPASGTVSVLGGPPRDDAEFWRSVAIVADQPTWYPGLTVRELLELVRMTHQPLPGWCVPTDDLIEIFGLTSRAEASPLSLSSGQRQRLSIAAALARPSSLLLLDEPEQSLDAGFRLELAALLRDEYAAGGGTVVMATHDHEFAVAADARIVALAEGRIVDEAGQDEAGQDEAGQDEAGQDENGGGADDRQPGEQVTAGRGGTGHASTGHGGTGHGIMGRGSTGPDS